MYSGTSIILCDWVRLIQMFEFHHNNPLNPKFDLIFVTLKTTHRKTDYLTIPDPRQMDALLL